jgi:succinate dehydrogenase / fumarate reductase flavoprotein subunit
MAQSHLSPIRTLSELDSLIQFLEEVKRDGLLHLATSSKSRIYNKEWFDALELPNMIHLLEAATRSALLRTESRGVHCREDYLHTDNDRWLCESIVTCVDGALEIGTRPPAFTSITPPKGVTPYLDMWKKMMEAHSPVGGHH